MDPLQRSRSSRSPLSRKSPPRLSAKYSQLLTPSHKRTSPLSALKHSPTHATNSPRKPSLLDKGLLAVLRRPTRKSSARRTLSRGNHQYSTSLSTAADSAAIDLSRSKNDPVADDDVNAIRTPSSRRLCDSSKDESSASLEQDLLAYSRTQVSPKSIGLDYIQCETIAIPFYSVTPSRRHPKTQKQSLSLYTHLADIVPARSQTPPLERILHKRYLHNAPKEDTPQDSDQPTPVLRRPKPQRKQSVLTRALTPKSGDSPFPRRRKKQPVLALPRLLPI